MTCDEVERNLDPFIDRELPADADGSVREHLVGCVPCRERVAEREAVGRMVRSIPYYEAPERLRARVVGEVRRSRSRSRLFAWAAAAVLVLSIGGGMSLLRSGGSGDSPAVGAVVDAHVRSLMVEHLFDVRSTDQHTVKPWFVGKLDFSPPVADLAAIGFPLMGGRLDYVSGRPVAALVYQRQKHTINVFVWPTSDAASDVKGGALRGFHVRRWVRQGMSFCVVSDLNEADLTEFARALRAS